MLNRNMPLALAIIGCLALGLGLLLFPRPVSAQCGSSASSCKNCHEVQGKAPVNTKGEWHTAHAFGDFCEFCHGGNVKAGAHAGLVDPLGDVKASCQSCHANDYMDRAKKYAGTLGTPIGNGAAPAASMTNGVLTTAAKNAPCGPAAPTGGETIDLNRAFEESVAPPGPNIGNLILIALIGGTLVLLLGLVWHYEKPLPKALAYGRQLLATPVITATTPQGVQMPVPAGVARRPEFAPLEAALASSDPATVRAVTRLLADREDGPKILKALSNMDLQSLSALGESDQKGLAALLALMQEMKAAGEVKK
jgi:hypothetical protein